MPRKTKPAGTLPSIPKELLDQLVTGPMTPEAVQDVMMSFKKALIERALNAEMSHHLGYEAGAPKPAEVVNHRNGKSRKTVLTDDGSVHIDVPVSAKVSATCWTTCISSRLI